MWLFTEQLLLIAAGHAVHASLSFRQSESLHWW